MSDFETLTGLEYLQKMIKECHTSAMTKTMNMRLLEVEDGKSVFEAIPSEYFYNPQRRVHGGYVATLIDSALGCAVQTKLGRGVGFGTIELNVNYVRKLVAETGRLVCTGTVLHAGRTMLTAEAKVAGPDGKLYAHGSGTFLVYPG
jgi:uncharacterized protein (TIGR00369 family)